MCIRPNGGSGTGEESEHCFGGVSGHVLLGVHIGPKLARIWLRVIGGKFGRLVDDRADFGVDLFQGVLARKALLQQAVAHLLERIVLGADLVYFLLGPLVVWVRHAVAAASITPAVAY